MKLYTKKLIFAFVFCLTLVSVNAQITWNGAGATNNFSDAGNWAGGIVPGAADPVIFDGTSSKNCNFDVDIDVASLSVNGGYGGTINALATNPTIEGAFSIAAGTFISTSQVLTTGGNMTFTGGTFTHNNGVIEIAIAFGATIVMSGPWSFFDLSVIDATPLSAPLRTMDFGAAASVADILLLNGGSKPFAYKGTINVSKTLQIQGSNISIPAGNTGIFNFNGASATIIGAGAAARNKIGNITINTVGAVAMSGDISLTGNWINTNIGSFTTGTSIVDFYGASCVVTSGNTATTRAYFDNIDIQSGATLNVTAGSHLEFSANFTHDGTYTGNTSLLRFTGASGHTIGGAAVLTSINAIEKTGAGALSFGHAINLLDSIRISGGAVTLTNLTLKSTGSLKGRIAEISGGGSVAGNVTVETFVTGGKTDWANLGASGVSGLTFNSWYPTIPMCIAGSPTGVTSAGGKWFQSVQGWNEGNAYGYDTTMTVTTPINVGQGYWLYVGNGPTVTSAITTIVNGPAVSGGQSLPLSNSLQSGYCLLANPFASPISWDRVFASDGLSTSGAIYIYNADVGLTSSYSGGVTSPAGSGASATIPMGQGFYVQANPGFANLTISESHKVSNNTAANPLIKANQTTASSIGSVIRLRIDDSYGYYDDAAIRFHPSATTAFDNGLDASKYFDSPGYIGYPGIWTKRTTISTQSGGKDYSINSLPYATTTNAVIPVRAKVYATGQHTISASGLSNLPPGTCFILKDKLLNINHNLTTGDYVCTINDTTSAPRFELTVCSNITLGVNNVVPSENVFVKNDVNGVYVDLNFEKSTKSTITAINMLGQQIMTPKQVECTNGKYYLDLNAKEQIIIVNVVTQEKRYTKKMYVPQY